jgi:hypothetical protein
MKVEVHRIGRILRPTDFKIGGKELSHCANPVVVPVDNELSRVFFNSRDDFQRSSVYSVDIEMQTFEVVEGSFKAQHQLTGENNYYRDGISLGSHFSLQGDGWIGFMGWINPPNEHWYGTIGKFRLDGNLNLTSIDSQPWFDLDNTDQISLSYPALYFSGDEYRIWYGSTLTWEASNGEMIHILKERRSRDGVLFEPTNREVQWDLVNSQAFSRPSILKVGDQHLMAYSVRGSNSKYRIGFGLLKDETNLIREIGSFYPSEPEWAGEMVEYPYLFAHNKSNFMFYNGDSFGKTGVGLAEIIIR